MAEPTHSTRSALSRSKRHQLGVMPQGAGDQVSRAPATQRTRKPGRRLGIEHFAFMRAVVQGLDLRESWDRYLRVEGDSRDLRRIHATVTWIRDEFAAAARREDRHGTARLVRMDANRLVRDEVRLPSLEAFAAERGLDEFSEADQMVAFELAFGKSGARLKRRQQLVAKQLEALRWLEALVVQPPSPGDAVQAWMHPDLARLLEGAGVITLAQLVERVNGIGRRWYGGIRSMGPVKAQRIMDWLRQHEDPLGVLIGSHVERPRSQLFTHELQAVVARATDIRPLEKFIVPQELDGRQGLFRRPQSQCLLPADNDYQAIYAWLQSKQGVTPQQRAQLLAGRRQRSSGEEQGADGLLALSNTQRAYRKEAERLLLWAVIQRGRALSSMSHEDCVAYRDFLADPLPRERWCGPRARERWSPLWRPFEGPLSASAQHQAITILKSFYSFLLDQGYLMGNPWSGVDVAKPAGPVLNVGRSLTLEQWRFVQSELNQRPKTSANQRLGLAMRLAYATGLRPSELCAARVDDLRRVEYPAAEPDLPLTQGWMLCVIGKGQRVREVPVPSALIDELGGYLVSRGLHYDTMHPDNRGAHLLGKASDADLRAPGLGKKGRGAGGFDPRAGVATTTLYDQLVACFEACARALAAKGDARGALKLAQASTHWLRHSHASHAIAEGVPIEVVQKNLGHVSLATTTMYVSVEAKKADSGTGQVSAPQ
jgi:site-specific recombinase XerD